MVLLTAPFNLLVHCRVGLGKAGTIAARLLVELEVEPREAARQVPADRPGAIEGAAQEAHVLGLQAVPEPRPSATVGGIRDRARGGLLGLAVGDAVGITLELRARDATAPITDTVGGGPFRLKPGQWTGDAAMALADSPLAHPQPDERDLMEGFVAWHEQGTHSCTGTCFDIGGTTRAALARYRRTGNPVAGYRPPRGWQRLPHAPRARGGEPLAGPPTLRDAAARQSRTTHAAPEAVDACLAYAEVLADAIAGERGAVVMRGREGLARDGLPGASGLAGAAGGTAGPRPLAEAIDPILAGSWRGKPRSAIHAPRQVGHTLEAALWSVGASGSFGEAVLRSANLGEDADTTAAAPGQLAGALGGGAIQKPWQVQVA